MSTNFKHDITAIVSQFCLEGKISAIEPYISGHINDTFLVRNEDPNCVDYLLQRINGNVFKDIPAMIANIQQVTSHLRKKLAGQPGSDVTKEVLYLNKTRDGLYYYKDNSGNYWRIYNYIKDTNSYNIVTTEQQAYQGGLAFGRFQALLSDLDINLLTDTIPDFHNIEKRLESFRKALLADPKNRVKEVTAEIDFINQRADKMCAILRLGEEGKLPKRITHNDTKFNNVLLNKNDEAQCVVDLDTVMAGYVAYDFGDAIRTSVNTAVEDEKDLDKIDVNIPLFAAFTKGYLAESKIFITPDEVNSLFLGALLLPYMQAVRFLTDYIEGDHYFKIDFPEHNLQRTKAQLKLLLRLEKHSEELQALIITAASS